MSFTWSTNFLAINASLSRKMALIILNQPFSSLLLERVWNSTQWHCCADGGANRLHDTSGKGHVPDLIKGDLDSLRDDVKAYYTAQGVPVVQDHSQDSTDLMKCISSLEEKEQDENQQYDIILLGGLSGRLDQTIHTLSFLHKLRKTRERVFAVTDDNIGWVLDSGEHTIHIDHTIFGPTCGLLPVGIDSTVLSTNGLQWNLSLRQSRRLILSCPLPTTLFHRNVYGLTRPNQSGGRWNYDQTWTLTTMTSSQITILYFAAASSATGVSSENITLPPEPFKLSQLGGLLVSKYPDSTLKEVLESSQWSVDAEMVDDPDKVVLKDGNEVAIICPVSGG